MVGAFTISGIHALPPYLYFYNHYSLHPQLYPKLLVQLKLLLVVPIVVLGAGRLLGLAVEVGVCECGKWGVSPWGVRVEDEAIACVGVLWCYAPASDLLNGVWSDNSCTEFVVLGATAWWLRNSINFLEILEAGVCVKSGGVRVGDEGIAYRVMLFSWNFSLSMQLLGCK